MPYQITATQIRDLLDEAQNLKDLQSGAAQLCATIACGRALIGVMERLERIAGDVSDTSGIIAEKYGE
ncbi:MAG: hypothetical protein OXF79_08390 [Chloroflexi bacterium]|nr:hypothetical protein [Chloroflexota bacterium]